MTSEATCDSQLSQTYLQDYVQNLMGGAFEFTFV